MKTLTYDQLTEEEKKLVDTAEKALENAYNPYSNTTVAATVLSESGDIFPGASYRNHCSNVNMCGERAAVFNANSSGQRKIKALATIPHSKKEKYPEPLAPCGICREFLLEIPRITGKDLIILSSNSDKTKITKMMLSELIPLPYSNDKN